MNILKMYNYMWLLLLLVVGVYNKDKDMNIANLIFTIPMLAYMLLN